ncbi:hypothetical protein AVEN_114914-1 [Araneus ventricosus]|uniref:Uncharacterized protein n=1 Tax=Araneus ventricosus TaxID=182803 RepID=A0A4Y2RM19_ARAVE|nr:hypothetical protein AVEN_114914-1 [Araneus ventricosus]
MQNGDRDRTTFGLVSFCEIFIGNNGSPEGTAEIFENCIYSCSKDVRQHLAILEADGKDLGKLSLLHSQLDHKFSRLEAIQKEISSFLLEDTTTHPEYEAGFEAAESYRDRYIELKNQG